ncbi:MAG: discoidin domain-containing protein [Clostridia bacterium]|nr:discoidin domain-containing protein [Clostridia bacterium]
MKKALALLLTLAMLATMTAVPAWAEEDVAFDIPVIEEVTEEELEEDYVEIFGDEVELMESTMALQTFEPAEGDGVTYFTELTDASVSYTGGSEGDFGSITNGMYTTGTWGDTSKHSFYYHSNGKAEGFLGLPANNANPTTITIDFGEPKTFSGVRIYDASRSRSYSTGGVRDIKTINMQVSNDNLFKWHGLDAAARSTDATATESGDFVFKSGGTAINVTARYLRFTVSAINGFGEFELEEIVMLDPVTENATKVMDTDITVNINMSAALTDAEKQGVTMLTAGDSVNFDGTAKASLIDGTRGGETWSLGSSNNTAGHYAEVVLSEAKAFRGVRMWMNTRTASWANGYWSADTSQNGNVRRIPTSVLVKVSDDGENWEELGATIERNDTYWYLDIALAEESVAANFTAKYIRVIPKAIKDGWGEWEIGEVALINTDDSLEKSFDSVAAIDAQYDYYKQAKYFTHTSGAGIPIEYEGKTYTNTGNWNSSDLLFDGNLSGTSYYHTAANISVNGDGNAPYVPIPEEIRTITITFNEAKAIGGFRIYGRTDNMGGNPYRVSVYASNDGEEYIKVLNSASTGFSNSTPTAPATVKVEKNLPAYKYYKFVVNATAGSGSTTAHTCYAELQVLKPIDFGVDLHEGDFIPYPVGKVETYTVAKDGTASLHSNGQNSMKLIDGVIIDSAILAEIQASGGDQYAYQVSHDYKIGGCIADDHAEKSKYTSESAYILYDLGSTVDFSGVRIYGRTAHGSQAFKSGYVYVSEDGVNWLAADEFVTDSPMVNDLSFKFDGTAYNARARYVKIHCLATNSGHWSMEEIRLLNPVDANETKTPTELEAVFAERIDAVEALIEAIGEVTEESADKVIAAREAYDLLPDGLKSKVENYETLLEAEAALESFDVAALNAKIAAINPYDVTLEDASEIADLQAEYDALSDGAKANIVGFDTLKAALSGLTEEVWPQNLSPRTETNKGGELGYTTVDYTLYVSGNDVTVTGVTYEGEAVTNTYDEWTYVNNGDGTMTFTLGGNYWDSPEWNKWLYSMTRASIQSGKAGTGYYTFVDDMSALGAKAGDNISEELFKGFFVRKLTSEKMGDHKLVLTLSDGTTKEIILSAKYQWNDVNVTVGSDDAADAISVSKIKVASNNLAPNGGYARWFNGGYGDATNAETYTARWRDTAGTDKGVQHLVYAPGPLSVWVDFGTATTLGGIRATDKSYNLNDTSVYGSDDLVTWTLIGEKKDNAAKKTEVIFDENETYRYIQIRFDKFQNGNATYLFMDEIVFLKPMTRVSGESTISVDPSEGNKASFKFAFAADETLTGVTLSGAAVTEYTYEDGTLTFNDDYITSLADGSHVFTATFSNGATLTLTVDKKDTSKVTYTLANSTSRASENLVFESLRGVKAESVAITDGNIALAFTQSVDNKTITIGRTVLRQAYDLFATMDVAEDGVVEILVTYEDDSTKTYYVTIKSDWIATGEPVADFLADEIKPAAGAWKVRGSSYSSTANLAAFAFYKKAVEKKDNQNWHSAFSTVDGQGGVADSVAARGHYVEVDFGENMTKYAGIRHRERAGGTTWNTKVIVWGKANANDDWVELHNAKPVYKLLGYSVEGNHPMFSTDILFAEPVTYRYLRIQAISTSAHITADTIHIIKAVAKPVIDNSIVDINTEEDAIFTFKLVSGNESALTLTNGDVTLTEDDYAWDKETGTLTVKASYTNNLPVGDTTLVATIDGFASEITVTKQDKYAVTYALTGGATNARGDEELYLPIVGEKTVTAVKYGEKNVPFVVEEGKIKIARPDFRNLDDMFDMTSIKLTVSFEGEADKPYTVNLTNVIVAVTGVVTDNFLEDEIIPEDNEWSVKYITANNNDASPDRMFKKYSGVAMTYHTGYTGNGVADIRTNRHTVDVYFAEAESFAGFRYYARTNTSSTAASGYDDSGVWHGAALYGRNADTDEWTLIKSQAFDTSNYNKSEPAVNAGSIYNTREATVYFGEDVTYSQVRIVIDCSTHATAKHFTFLKAGTRASVPEVEDEINIKVTPTTGGNVTVNETPSLGDNYVAANKEVTFTASSDVEGGFQYWIEANTGKILGTNPSLTVKSAIGKDIKAVFADPSAFEAFVSFYGRNAKNILASSYVKKGNAPTVPSEEKLYTTGYEFKFWTNKEGTAVDAAAAVTENTEFYAYYEKKEDSVRQSVITVTGGTIAEVGSGVAGTESGTFAYDTKVCATANTAPDGQKFSHWTLDGKTVSYASDYFFFAPDADITLKAVFVADTEAVEKEVTITITETSDVINGVNVAGFITTRYVPTGTEVIETGVIYVKDASYGDLTIASVGKTSTNGKAVKAAFASETGTGQHKLSASYAELGIKARGFLTYMKDGALTTIYTDTITVTKTN